MKKHITKYRSNPSANTESERISRKEAIKKAGKYAALTAATALIILSPKQSQASSTGPKPPGWF